MSGIIMNHLCGSYYMIHIQCKTSFVLCNYFCIEIILTSQVVKSKQRFTCPTGDRNLKNVLAVIQFIESRNCYKYIKDFYCNVAGN